MKYAIVNDARSEAVKGLNGLCPNCKSPMIPKCGAKIIHHWAHKGKLECDHWWEPETQWHRDWKGYFPKEWQEVVHQDPITGERHIADVKTSLGIILEFQHSPIKPEERKSRNEFYKNIVWVVDGKRLNNDEANFEKAYNSGTSIAHVRKFFVNESSLLNKWTGLNVPVFFDFGQQILWMLIPIISDDITAYVLPIKKEDFLVMFRDETLGKVNSFWKWMQDFIFYIKNPQQNRRIVQFVHHARGSSFRGPRIDYVSNRHRHRNKKRRF